MAGLLLNPVIGLTIEQRENGYDDNEHGGRTLVVAVEIGGREALAWPALERLVRALGSQGTVSCAERATSRTAASWTPICEEVAA